MQIIGLRVSVIRRPRRIYSPAQRKHGQDIWRSIYYRVDWGQPWLKIAPTISRVRRWALRKFNNPPALYRKLKEVDHNAPERAA